jgi:hypothetical protein
MAIFNALLIFGRGEAAPATQDYWLVLLLLLLLLVLLAPAPIAVI